MKRLVQFLLAATVLATPALAADPELAITNVTVIDGTGRPAKSGMTVIVRDGRIASIGKGAAPSGAQVVDGAGKFLLPGFIDSNAHGTVYGQPSRRDTSAKYGDDNEALMTEFAQRSLKYGVTTIRDSYGVLPPTLIVRDRIARGELTGARIQAAGNIIGWGGTFSISFSLSKESDLSYFQEKWNDLMAQDAGEELMDMTPEELRVAMRRYLDKGVDFIKYGGTSHFMRPSLIGFSPAQQTAIVEEAHKRGKRVETHATSIEGLRLAVEAGIDLIQHPELMARDMPDSLVATIIAHKPLCGMRANQFTGTVWTNHLASRAAVEAQQAKAAPATTGAERNRRMEALDEGMDIQRRNALKLIKANCPITIATDNYLGDAPEFRRAPKPDNAEPGIGSLRAVQGLVELGMTPMQAIVAGTRNGGLATGIKDLGTIEPGKLADMVLLAADPLADIRNIEKISAVVAQGRVVDLAKLPEKAVFGEVH